MMVRYKVDDCHYLQLHIYVLGYFPEGESILIVLYDGKANNTLLSILSDCYVKDETNNLCKILNSYGIDQQKLDYIIWTHPDRDHSVGFNHIIKYYVSNKTLFILPEGLNIKEVIGSFDVLRSWIAIVKNQILGKNNVERVNTSNLRIHPLMYGGIFFDGVNDDIFFSLEILTPFANQNFRHLEYNRTHKGNHLSISFVVRMGELGFYFGGDSENMAINSIDKDKFLNLFFVKIPHHGSDTSDQLPAIIKSVISDEDDLPIISVTTGYHRGKSNLPLTSVLNLYKCFSTKILVTENVTHQNGYGIWDCRFNLISSNPWIYNSSGDAEVFY